MSRRRRSKEDGTLLGLFAVGTMAVMVFAKVIIDWFTEHPLALFPSAMVLVLAGFFVIRMLRERKQASLWAVEGRERAEREAEERRRELERRKEEERREQERQREAERRRAEEKRQEQKKQKEARRQELKRQWRERVKREEEEQRQRLEAMLHPDRVRDEINYMSGPEFERFMADLFRQKGYVVEETPLSGDQGVDLILPDVDGKRVVIQLKRWTGPVGNAAVQATFAGMAHYEAAEGWIITTGTFTKSAQELARSTSVRLIDGKELTDWLEGLREDE